MTPKIVTFAGMMGQAVGAFTKAKNDMMRSPQFVGDMLQTSAWGGGQFSDTDAATHRAIRNSWVYSAINTKSLDLGMSKFDVYNNPSGLEDEGEVAPGHDFLKVLRRPNPYMGTALMWSYTHWWMDLLGKSMWFIEPKAGGGVNGIWPLPANKMGFELTDDKRNIKRWILKLQQWWYLDPKYVCYFRYANPFDFFDGMPPLVSAMLVVDADLAMKTWNGSFFGKDNVMPSAVISLGSGDANRMIDPQDIDAVKQELGEEYAAINRKTIVTNANNMAVALLGYNAKDMDFLNGMAWNRDEIDWVFGVPPGMHDKNSTEANAKVGNKMFKDNMWGLKTVYADEISTQVLKRHYSDDIEFRFRDDRIADRQSELEEAGKAESVMYIDEVREKYFQMEPLPNGEGQRLVKGGPAPAGGVDENGKPVEPKPFGQEVDDEVAEEEEATQPNPDSTKVEQKSVDEELMLMKRKAVNRFKDKGNCVGLTFNPDVLDANIVKSILSDLSGVEQRSDIEEVFAHWKGEL